MLPGGPEKQHELLAGENLLADPDLLFALGLSLRHGVFLLLKVGDVDRDDPVLDGGLKHDVESGAHDPNGVL
ncbi:MAG TPA: hypothetical protein VGK65_17515 [Candidatus Binatia bacterium]